VPADATAHQLRITIDEIRPPIWRRVLVPSRITLAQLHRFIQQAFEWSDSHLHEFEIGGVTYGTDEDDDSDERPVDERRTKLDAVASNGDRFQYTYDFGDYWVHRIEVEAVVPLDPSDAYPRCVAGRRAAPPEDVGGAWGYARFLEAIAVVLVARAARCRITPGEAPLLRRADVALG
jgi:hypothetical protein